jgi:formylglycine-generating enzyme required for sulfatase activity
LAILGGTARIPEPLVAALIPHAADREALHRQLSALCFFQQDGEGWWPLISQVADLPLGLESLAARNSRVVDYYAALTGTAHWDDGYFRPQYALHCQAAGRSVELAAFFELPENLLWFLKLLGWRGLATELRALGLSDLASRIERLAPEATITLEELATGLSLGPRRCSLRVFLHTESVPRLVTRLEPFLSREGHTRSRNLADADVLLTHGNSSDGPILTARNAGLFVVYLYEDTVLKSFVDRFDAAVDISFDSDFEQLATELQRLATSLGQLSGVPDLPTPCLLRDELMGEARERLLDSRRGLVISGEPGIGKRTLATALCRMPVVRRQFPGGIRWGAAISNPNSGPTLVVLYEAEESTWPRLRTEDRLIVIRRKGAEAEAMSSLLVPSPGSAQARLLIELHSVPSDSHDAIVRFAGGNPGLLSQACRIVNHFSWKAVHVEFRLLPDYSRPALLSLAARKLPPQQQQQLKSLSILGVNPYPSRELAEYVAEAPFPEEFFLLGLVKADGPDVWVLTQGERPPDELASHLHRRVCNFYRQKWPKYFPARVPTTEAYYWQYIRHHLAQARDKKTLPAELLLSERWWEERDEGDAVQLLSSLPIEERAPVFLWWAEARPERATEYLLGDGTELVDQPGLLRKLQAAWLPRLAGPLSEPQPEGRAAIGRCLGLLGLDNRTGVGLLPDGVPEIDWVEIPAGAFLYQTERNRRDIERFYIARYPVTNEQFQAFLDAADGHRLDRWWKGFEEPHRTPKSPRRTERNSPRETVSWHEAMAYCAWLGHKLQLDVRLPTEWEWERAARGTEGKEYPWGHDYVPGTANIDERAGKDGPHYLERTSAVGIYPDGVSPEGVLDMSGNVWEWCLNEYDNPDQILAGGRKRRVVRGGSWLSDSYLARAAYRFNDVPFNRLNDIGFRVVCSSPIAGHGSAAR